MKPLTIEETAIELLKHALSWDRDARLLGNLRAYEIAALAASVITCCPACGAEPWCDIDCRICLVCSELRTER